MICIEQQHDGNWNETKIFLPISRNILVYDIAIRKFDCRLGLSGQTTLPISISTHKELEDNHEMLTLLIDKNCNLGMPTFEGEATHSTSFHRSISKQKGHWIETENSTHKLNIVGADPGYDSIQQVFSCDGSRHFMPQIKDRVLYLNQGITDMIASYNIRWMKNYRQPAVPERTIHVIGKTSIIDARYYDFSS